MLLVLFPSHHATLVTHFHCFSSLPLDGVTSNVLAGEEDTPEGTHNEAQRTSLSPAADRWGL